MRFSLFMQKIPQIGDDSIFANGLFSSVCSSTSSVPTKTIDYFNCNYRYDREFLWEPREVKANPLP